MTLKGLQHSAFFPFCQVCGTIFEVWDLLLLHIAPCNGLQGAVAQYAANQARNTDKCTGFFNMCYTTHRPTAEHPIRRLKQSWFSVLLKDTSVTTGTRTHTLLIRNTSVESGALNRSATSLYVTRIRMLLVTVFLLFLSQLSASSTPYSCCYQFSPCSLVCSRNNEY